jgi:FkbM family methyltransferase
LLTKNKVLIKEINGITYELHLNQLIDSAIYYDGYFEKDSAKAITTVVKPGMRVFDIGANIGCHLLPMAKLVGEKGYVIAFEPMEWPLKKLKRNIELNRLGNIIVENIGLSNVEEDKTINFRASWTIDKSEVKESKRPATVHFTTIDNYVSAHNIKQVDFIKLDVDGYEYKILQGGRDVLMTYRPIILMELGDYTLRSVGDNIEDLINFLFSLDYKFYTEKGFHLLETREDIIKSIPDLKTLTVNVILCHISKLHLLK